MKKIAEKPKDRVWIKDVSNGRFELFGNVNGAVKKISSGLSKLGKFKSKTYWLKGLLQIVEKSKRKQQHTNVEYPKVPSSSLSWLVAWIFRMFMKGKFDAYVLWPLSAFDPKS